MFKTILLLIAGSLIAHAQNPKIQFENATYDFGEIDLGTKVNAEFKFKNTGDATLRIIDVTPTCGCTTVNPEKELYEPGESGTISVTFDSTRFPGKISKRVNVVTNDPEAARATLTIEGNVAVDIIYYPKRVYFTNAPMGEKQTREIIITTTRLDKLELSKLKVSKRPDCFDVALVKIDAKSAKLVVTADGNRFPSGPSRLDGMITLTSNSKAQKNLRIPVSVQVARPVMASPRSLYLFASKTGKAHVRRVKLISKKGEAFKVLGINTDSDQITVTQEKAEGHSIYLVVTLSEKAPAGRFEHQIKVTLDTPEMKELTIQVKGSLVAK